MNTRTALFALLLALMVAAGAWIALRTSPKAALPVRTWLAGLDPTQVVSIDVASSGGSSATLSRSEVPELWMLTETRSGAGEVGSPNLTWPVKGGRINGALRLFGDLEAAPAAQGAVLSNPVTITLHMADGTSQQLDVAETSLGGKTLIKIAGLAPAFRMADQALGRMFTDGLRTWRDNTIFNSDAGDFSRIRLQTIGRQLTLARSQGHWGVQVPIVAPADQGSCDQLGARLKSCTVVKFVDSPPGSDESLGLANPSAMLDTETEFRSAGADGVSRRVLLQQVKVGGPADATGQKLFASVRAQWLDPSTRNVGPAWGPVLVLVNRADFEPLSADAAPFLSRQAIRLAPADIGGVVISPGEGAMAEPAPAVAPVVSSRAVRMTRVLQGWRYKPSEGEPRPVPTSGTVQLDALLQLLAQQRADMVLTEAPAAATPLVNITMETMGGQELQRVGLGLSEFPAPGKPAQPGLVVRVGGLFRVYLGKGPLDIARWLAEELPPEG